MVRYAEYTPSRRDMARHYAGRALRWPLRPFRRMWTRIESSPRLIPLWERRAGQDYTGWSVRNLRTVGLLQAGEMGTVTGYELHGRHRRYTVAIGRHDLYTALPAPEYVELIPPTGR